jgi:S-DNA-T family DNA segregation ATPase FtsK/SpoIIIE
MLTQPVEQEILDAYARLSDLAGAAQRGHDHSRPMAEPSPSRELTAAHPWGLDDFGSAAWDGYAPDPDAPLPDGLRVGELRGVRLPAVARFAGYGHLLIAERGLADQARSLLQALTLRLATATRPGSVRFALADAVGQGRHLSAFLRLPARLRVGSGVAASQGEIEDLLVALTAHVVEVTQTRLTNVHDSVEAYNAATAGTAIPYHVLVLTGFPAGVSDRCQELLRQLARNGPRAGLYILATHSGDAPDLGASATHLAFSADGTVSGDDPEFGQLAISPDQMPAAGRANPWLDAVRAATMNSSSGNLAFSSLAGPGRWTGDTTDGIDAIIGTDSKGEPQHFTMGARGVHHGLVGGDVRMGKTNLLHVLICQLALRYPPEELELYLLDFKEVEFDAYLTGRLPHARAITSRTDREFGLSMLRRFHNEIDRRARLCREARVTDLPDYRRETGRPLPRALVIMDEFQVLFSEEDRLAREAGRLLADIAKRGAAFGLHLLLATQSPGGQLAAYLRPVYEQMALRIALGCTQPSVSQAILGEGNDAATRLIRAGDAIYNDRRGEGANPVMRIAILPTRERLSLIDSLADGREYPRPFSFDPDAPASFGPHSAPVGDAVAAWLGEAVEIKPPTTATFERYPRSNLLIIGGEEHGHGLLLATVLSAAAQRGPSEVSFTVMEFTRPSSRFHGFFSPARTLPHEVVIADRRSAASALDALETELDERLADDDGATRPMRFLLVAGMHRWQDLLDEGDYGRLSSTAGSLLRLADKGPDVGIHLVAWADSYATVDRALRRSGAGLFGMRAVLRVSSPAESDALLGVIAAAGLDDDRGLYRETEWPTEQVEKFKPYSVPSLLTYLRDVCLPGAAGGGRPRHRLVFP